MKARGWSRARRCVQLSVVALLASQLAGGGFFRGTLSASTLLGIPLADPLAALQLMLLGVSPTAHLLLGVALVSGFYLLLGGKSFCGWVCPVHLLTDLLERFPGRESLPRLPLKWKLGSLGLCLALTPVLGLPVFEALSPIGALGRAIGAGALSGAGLVLLILVAELFFARRLWCRSLCPLGAIYSGLGRLSPLRVAFEEKRCTGCRRCQKNCLVPEVLEPCIGDKKSRVRSGECSRCGSCIDACPTRALQMSIHKTVEKKEVIS